MSSIITSGYGPNQRLVLQGYGFSLGYLTKTLFQTLLVSDSVARRWNAFRTYNEAVSFVPGLGAYIIERITEVISRMLPYLRVPFKAKIKMKGDLVAPFSKDIPVYGDLFYTRKIGVDVIGSPVLSFFRTISLSGDKSFPFVFNTSLYGYPVHPSLIRTSIKGDFSTELRKKTKVKGEKDFIDIIKELLEDDENGN